MVFFPGFLTKLTINSKLQRGAHTPPIHIYAQLWKMMSD